MKTIKFVAYLFYRYYSTGATKDIPYISTLCALVMLLGLHLFQLLVLFDKVDLLPTSGKNTRAENFLIIFLCLIPIFLLMAFLVKKSELQQMNYEESRIKKGNLFLIIYIIASIATLLLLVIAKKGKL
jgi:hypothetical protein